MGNFSCIEFDQGSFQKVYVKFSDEQAGLKEMRLSWYTKFVGSYWKMWSWDSNKERISISIY